ncbi:MAG TPA: aminotransferase class IV, partial [Verrucomicrobiae bacterium]|nr:aminotransferase class IV [Verrucomicrobiae bacterium]
SCNLFWIKDHTVRTPPLASGILAGVTRLVVREICGKLGLPVEETNIPPAELKRADGVFLSLSSWGVVEAGSLDGAELGRSALAKQIQAAYREMTRS